jgi:uncharacterized protein YpmS
MSKSNSKEDDKFYEELDQDKTHGSCCTCYTLSLLFVFILLTLAVGSFYLYRQISSEKIFPLNVNLRTSLQDLTNRFNSLKLDAFNLATVELSEQDLNAIMSGGFSFQNFILKDVQTSIMQDEIILYGSLIKPLSSKVVIGMKPRVENGKIVFEVQSVQAGKLKIPKFMNLQIENNLNNSMDAKLGIVYEKLLIEDVRVEDRKIIMKGRLK